MTSRHARKPIGAGTEMLNLKPSQRRMLELIYDGKKNREAAQLAIALAGETQAKQAWA
jgi:hypothetical protein